MVLLGGERREEGWERGGERSGPIGRGRRGRRGEEWWERGGGRSGPTGRRRGLRGRSDARK